MTVGIDATSTALNNGVIFNNLSTWTTSALISVGPGATSLAVLVSVTNPIANPFPTGYTATWNGLAMTKLVDTGEILGVASANLAAVIFGIGSSAGTIFGQNTFVLNVLGNPAYGYVGAISFTGTDPVNPFVNPAAASGLGSLATVLISSSLINYDVAAYAADNSGFASPSGTLIYQNATGGGGGGSSGQYQAGSAPTSNLNYQLASNQWAAAGVDVLAAAPGLGVLGWSTSES